MSKTAQQHTPGPWRLTGVGKRPAWEFVEALGNSADASDPDPVFIATVSQPPPRYTRRAMTMKECEANAVLIAAAPELLAALVEARAVLESADRYFPSSIKNPDRSRLLNVLANAVSPAIAKATGAA